MSVSYWGDNFYGVNRFSHPEIFDKDKERKIIIESITKAWDKEYVDKAIEYYELTFDNVDELDIDNGADELTHFLDGTGVVPYHTYSSYENIMFFGIHYSLPWEIEKIETKEEVDRKIYNALKPILKDNITFEDFEPCISYINISGADDYVTYYEYRR